MKPIPLNSDRLCFSGYVCLRRTEDFAEFVRPIDDSPYSVDAPCCRIRFRTDAKALRVRFEYAAKPVKAGHGSYASAGAYRVDGSPAGVFTRASDERSTVCVSIDQSGPGFREYEFLPPYADKVRLCGIETDDDARFRPLAVTTRELYVAYGDSITQGFWASNPLHSCAWRLAETRGWDLVNLGYGGRCATASDGAAVANLRPKIASILIGVNDCLGKRSLEDFRANCQGWIENVRNASPTTRIVAVTPLNVPGNWPGTEHLERYRDAVRMTADERRGDKLTLIEGPDLIPSDLSLFQDGLHPNDAGFATMARNLDERL